MNLFFLFAFFGLAYIIKESDLFAPARNWIMQRSPFMIRLLSCWWCVGFWAGVIVYLLHGSVGLFESFSPFDWLIWGFAGSSASALGNAAMEKLQLVEVKGDSK